jgi:hypothetical protein
MLILRTGPLSKRAKRRRDTFLRLVGECVTRWAFVDRSLFLIFKRALNTDLKSAGVASPSNFKTWKQYNKRMDSLLPVRNIIAHHPLLQATTGARHQYFIRVEPYEVEAGYRAPRAIDVKTLRLHAKQVDKLTHRLSEFAAKVSTDFEARAKNLRGE